MGRKSMPRSWRLVLLGVLVALALIGLVASGGAAATDPIRVVDVGGRSAAQVGAIGYYVLINDGGILTFGDAQFFGSVPGLPPPFNRAQALGMALSPTGQGYYVVTTDGGVFTFGDAQFFGSIPGLAPPNNLARPRNFA